MAENEILSHAELLLFSRDIILKEDNTLIGLGTQQFESLIRQETET